MPTPRRFRVVLYVVVSCDARVCTCAARHNNKSLGQCARGSKVAVAGATRVKGKDFAFFFLFFFFFLRRAAHRHATLVRKPDAIDH